MKLYICKECGLLSINNQRCVLCGGSKKLYADNGRLTHRTKKQKEEVDEILNKGKP